MATSGVGTIIAMVPTKEARVFRDRSGAGSVLADQLAPRLPGPVVVAGVPRGGLRVAQPIAARLKASLAIVYAQKLTVALAPELAIGALDEEGRAIIDSATVAALGIGSVEIEAARARVAREIAQRIGRYSVPPFACHLPGPEVVLVDDGLATGLTMEVAVAYARRHGAQRVIVAAPCASMAAAERLRPLVDGFVCPIVDEDFAAVAQYYLDFSPVTDAEVLSLLGRAGPRDLPEAATIGSGGRS